MLEEEQEEVKNEINEDFVIVISSSSEGNEYSPRKHSSKDLISNLICHIRRDTRSVAGILYIIGTLFGLIGFVLGVIHVNNMIREESKVRIEFVLISFFLMLNFFLKIYFMWPRALARIVIILFSVGFAAAFITYTVLYVSLSK